MSNIKLDLKRFKHIKSDKHSTTLQHPDGHTITMAHKALGPEAKQQLEALSKISSAAQTPANTDELKHKGMLAEGGGVEAMYADQLAPKLPQQMPSKQPQPHRPPMSRQNDQASRIDQGHGKVIRKMAEGGEVDHEHEGSKFCMHCGGAMMAEGGGVPDYLAPNQEDPIGGSTQIPDIAKGIDKTAKETNQKELQNMYSNQVVQHARQANPMGGPLSGLGMQSRLPGPNGEPPQDIDPGAAQEAQIAFQQKKTDEAKQRNDEQQKNFSQAQKSNQAAAIMGWPQQPMPEGGPDGARAPMVPEQQQPNVPFPEAEKAPADAGGSYQNNIMGGYNEQLAGIRGAGKALGALGEQQAAAQQNYLQEQHKGEQLFQSSYGDLEKERQAHMQDIKDGLINPDKYWTGDPQTGQGGHSKIMTGIGMILAGFNPTSSPNAAIGFLQNQMNANLESQKQNLGAKNNLLAANLRQFGNLKDATDMTRIMQNDAVAHMLQANADKAQGGPQGLAAMAAKQAAGPLMREAAQLQFQMGVRQTMSKLSNGQAGDPSNTTSAEHMINQMMSVPGMQDTAKMYAGMLVPGVGISSTQQVSPEIRSELIGKKNFDQMAKHYVQWVKQNAGSINPKVNAQGAAMAAELQGAYRQATKGGVFKEGEQNFIERLIPSDPAQFAQNYRTLPKVEELIRSNNSQFENIKQGVGIHTPQAQGQPQQQQGPHPREGQTGVDQQGRRVKIVNGKPVPI